MPLRGTRDPAPFEPSLALRLEWAPGFALSSSRASAVEQPGSSHVAGSGLRPSPAPALTRRPLGTERMAMTMCRPEKAALTGLAGALLLAALTALSADPDAAYLADLRRSLRLLERDAVLQLRGLDKLEQSRRKRAGELAQKEMQLFSEIEQQDDRQRRKELLEELRKCQSELRVEREQIAGIVEHQRPRMEKEIVEARQAMELKRDVLSGKKEPPIRYCPVQPT
jgi:hypothetical protein